MGILVLLLLFQMFASLIKNKSHEITFQDVVMCSKLLAMEMAQSSLLLFEQQLQQQRDAEL